MGKKEQVTYRVIEDFLAHRLSRREAADLLYIVQLPRLVKSVFVVAELSLVFGLKLSRCLQGPALQ